MDEHHGSADHHGQDDADGTLSGGQTQHEMDGSEQDQPILAQNNAPDSEKIAGIVAQTRIDAADQEHESVRHILAQRLEQAGVQVEDDELDGLVDEVKSA
ncbi:hypothetical protein GCM10022200_27730 [Microbacterium awajiense]|uniref:Uncharacterized protein n=1 Tax=Microbacterium awajiense TaxID=415214 RepID=A0ABP7AXP8_9MICO